MHGLVKHQLTTEGIAELANEFNKIQFNYKMAVERKNEAIKCIF